ncbi:uncharacterized protein LOC125229355 [Leguminivora glycinivorella]|uniref:uncharacterized protein LOC125229355 n=1 Tax=Leguminivora glycinivorella TaxID=1035111 RepID=UPI0020100860|nr:uncharacterized protein LOC125229355 [Leguminivora glycinivorella]
MESEEALVRNRNPSEITGLLKADKTRLKWISWYVIVQCITVFIGVATILHCFWKPNDGTYELEILARIMYLYDTNACEKTRSFRKVQNILFSNNTFGYNIIPIKNKQAAVNVVTKLSGLTRTYMKFSLGLHVFWFVSAILLHALINVRNMKVMKIVLKTFRFVTMTVVVFDVCMAIVYIADIQQSLTKAMIIRYSGWGMTPSQIMNPDSFGGWVPIMASALWLRGGIFFINLYLVRFVKLMIQKIRGKEVKSRISKLCNVPFPEATSQREDGGALYYRAGQYHKF